jgi:hypothetical protein
MSLYVIVYYKSLLGERAPIAFYSRNSLRQYSKRDPKTVCRSYNEQF